MDELKLSLYDDIAQIDEPVLELSESYRTKYWRGIDSDISFSLILKRKNGAIQLIVDQESAEIGVGKNNIGLDESMLITYTIKLNLDKPQLLNYVLNADNLDGLVDDTGIIGLNDNEATRIRQDFIDTKKSISVAMTSLMNQVMNWIKTNYGECPDL